ncbi:putative transmembrane protein [Toxoplasma gondii TgCatPRC2]|uniref:Putative transmembrane protein n=1 Tax=Toxoplasma gondii TgCatPRC2 TaxID=1130821 RepID=A0A151HAN1_TOXGO|nr:putative transmembrane protein [Toxoplasma gondii TgCatPRC2]
MSPFTGATKTRVASSSVKTLLLRLLPLLLLAGSPAWAKLCRASKSVAAQAEFRVTGGRAHPPSGSAHAAKRRGLENEASTPVAASRRTRLALSSQDSRGAAAGSVETAGDSVGDPDETLSILSSPATSDEALENVSVPPQPSSRRRSEHQEVPARPSPSALPLLGHEGTASSADTRDTGAGESPSAAEASVSVDGENAGEDSSRVQTPSFGKYAATVVGPEDSEQSLLASPRNRVSSSLPETSMKSQWSQPSEATLTSTSLTSPCLLSAELPPMTQSVASSYLPRGMDERQRPILSTFASLVSSPLTKTSDQASKNAFFASRLLASGISLSSLPDALKGDANAGKAQREVPRPMGQQAAPSSLRVNLEKANNKKAFSVASEAEASGASPTGLGLWLAILPQVKVQSRFLRGRFAAHGEEERQSQFRLSPRSSRRPRSVLPFLSRHKVKMFFGAVLVTLALWLLWSTGKKKAENCEQERRVSVASEGRGEGRTESMSDPQLFKRFFGNPKQMRFRAQEQGSFGEHQDRETVDDIMRWREYLRPAR